MKDKFTEFLLNSLQTDVVVISAFLLLVGVCYWVYSKACK
jgi:putative effector of murein hydrolase